MLQSLGLQCRGCGGGSILAFGRRVGCDRFVHNQDLISPRLKWFALRYGLEALRKDKMTKHPKPGELVTKLRQADLLISQDQRVADTIRALGVSSVTYATNS